MKAKSILLVVRQNIQTRIMIRKKALFLTTPNRYVLDGAPLLETCYFSHKIKLG